MSTHRTLDEVAIGAICDEVADTAATLAAQDLQMRFSILDKEKVPATVGKGDIANVLKPAIRRQLTDLAEWVTYRLGP
jgi:hypothetical protein